VGEGAPEREVEVGWLMFPLTCCVLYLLQCTISCKLNCLEVFVSRDKPGRAAGCLDSLNLGILTFSL
jgi:hypothetical protein